MLSQLLILMCFSILVPILLWSYPTGYILFSFFVLILALVVMVRPMPQYRMGSRVFALMWILLAGFPGLIFSTSLFTTERDTYLSELRGLDPAAYLTAIEYTDPELWFRELRQFDPERFEVEVVRRAEDARRLRAQRATEVQRMHAHQCSAAYAEQAYVYAQIFVEQALRAPNTASFPNIRRDSVQVSAVGQCRFQVRSYVDARNAFNAEIRTWFSITLERLPEEDSWAMIAIAFD